MMTDLAQEFLLRANQLAAEGRLRQAGPWCQAALELQPELHAAHLPWAMVAEREGDLEQAQESYAKTLQANPGHPELLVKLAKLNLELKRWSAAEDYARQLEAFPEQQLLCLKVRALAAWQSGRLEAAEQLFTQALALAPDDLKLLRHLAICLAQQHRSAEFNQLTHQVVQRDLAALAGDMGRPEFWLSLNPHLSIGRLSPGAPPPVGDSEAEELQQRLVREGYFQKTGALDPQSVHDLRLGIENLVKAGLRPVYILVYDQCWSSLWSMAPVLKTLLGEEYRMLPGFWAWYLDAQQESAGWPPHRDRGEIPLLDGGRSDNVNLWIALSPATPDNGCIYMVPADQDPDYGQLERGTTYPCQAIRALPAQPGDLLGWNGQVFHWGGQCSPRCTVPRISIANDYQRGDRAPLEHPLLDPHRFPPLEDRLALVGLQIARYVHMY